MPHLKLPLYFLVPQPRNLSRNEDRFTNLPEQAESVRCIASTEITGTVFIEKQLTVRRKDLHIFSTVVEIIARYQKCLASFHIFHYLKSTKNFQLNCELFKQVITIVTAKAESTLTFLSLHLHYLIKVLYNTRFSFFNKSDFQRYVVKFHRPVRVSAKQCGLLVD